MFGHRAPGFVSGSILLPFSGADMSKWAVIACDQFTSDKAYWDEVESIVGNAPSTLRITLPEIYLSESEQRTEKIRACMQDYTQNGIMQEAVSDGFVLVDRTTTQGHRLGLVGLIDLEQYDYRPGTKLLVRPTEGTIPERVPPRAKIRSGATVEIPHVMMLIDDPECLLIEKLYAARDELRKIYDFELMQDGGHITGYAVEDSAADDAIEALNKLHEGCGGLLYAVGDGNHSLAAAKRCWEDIKKSLSDEDIENHPVRYAMVELVNIHCPALVFEPIHRIVKGADMADITAAYEQYLSKNGVKWSEGSDVRVISRGAEKGYGFAGYPLGELQEFLSGYVADHPELELDYIHGEDDLVALSETGVGFLLQSISKSELLPFVRDKGVLPRKAFSMGEARDKRYYLEVRRLTY